MVKQIGGMNMEVVFYTEVKELANEMFLITAVVEGVKVLRTHKYIEDLKTTTIREVRQKYTLDNLKEEPRVKCFRHLYWLFGMDPTKIRPSAEALARRVLSGGGLPTINSIVDSNNVASLKHLLPIGIYDATKLEGELSVRLAKEGEPMTKIGGKVEALTNKELVVSDEKKIVGLGYASSDSDFTRVFSTTQNIAVLVYCAPGISTQAGQECMKELIEHIITSSGGTCTERLVFR